jgi:hypothetical protein
MTVSGWTRGQRRRQVGWCDRWLHAVGGGEGSGQRLLRLRTRHGLERMDEVPTDEGTFSSPVRR